MFPFRRLVVWQRAHALAATAYRTRATPATAPVMIQLRRALGSVSANIVEGAGSASHAQFARYLGLALASAHEAESHLLLGRDAEVIAAERADAMLSELEQVKAMLTVLRNRVSQEARAGRRPKVDAPRGS